MNTKSPFRKQIAWLASVIVLAAMVLAACSPAAAPTQAVPVTGPTAAPTTAPTMAPTTAAVTEPTINVATDPKLGKILVDGKGMTLYVFTKDTADKSNCAGGCLKAWPALATAGSPKAGTGVDQSMLGSTAAADGSKIVTYNHMPLYYYAKDQKPGDVTGQNVGQVWFVVSPDGKMVKDSGSAAATPAATTAAAASSEATINVATDPKLGKILVDGKGMTLYMFKKDTADTSNCAGGCLKAWPPLATAGSPKAGDGVDQSKLGSASLPDGSKIVTYNHMPLYYFAKDQKPGDVTGQDVGQVWYVVSPDGKPVEDAAGSSGNTGSNSSANSVEVKVANDAKLGQILVDGKGMTLYMFTKDTPDKSNCSGGCLKAWPPLTVAEKAEAGDGANASLLGTATLADGSKIVTYNHLPLYYWAGDTKPGDTSGQGVNNVWYVVSPDGKPVGMQGSSTGY